MVSFHVIAIRPGDRRKSIVNKTEDQVLTECVVPYVTSGAIKTKWGSKTQTFQVIELRVYKTNSPWDKKSGVKLEEFLRGKRNLFASFQKKAIAITGASTYRVFVVMPIQGEKYGTQDEQRIHREYDARFEAIEAVLAESNCVAIRIDKEHPLEQLVASIKKEIKRADFIIADLTDERPSCYFEAGYAEALGKPVVYVASKESVIKPGTKTRIHFDVHMTIRFFTNNDELSVKLQSAISKNKEKLFGSAEDTSAVGG